MSSAGSTDLRTSSSRSGFKDIYLYEMPSFERHNLCSTLDDQNIWPELAVNHMGYRKEDLEAIKRSGLLLGHSPADELLTWWGEQNHTVTELFILLNRMQQYTAMDAIRNLVDRKYHRLIMSGQPDLSNLMISIKSEKILNGRLPDSVLSNSNNEETSVSSYEEESENNSNRSSLNIKNIIKKGLGAIPEIGYNELAEATMEWNSKNILGKGGFGTVFKGVWKNTAVAIKRIEYHGTGTAESNKIQIQQIFTELKHLNSCRHDNILPLYGYSINGNEPCLVYQLMIGGSLEQRLNSARQVPLSCSQRLNIAQGTARGLQYLHTFREKPLIHGDIKPANILLDPCSQPKIGDFGLAREGPNTLNSAMEVSKVYGTKPYLPLEFLGYKSLSTKVDTYSFGVVLFELVTGLRAYDKNRKHKFLTRHIITMCEDNASIESLMDKNMLATPEAVNACRNLISLGKICISEKPDQRPEMVTVLWHLESK